MKHCWLLLLIFLSCFFVAEPSIAKSAVRLSISGDSLAFDGKPLSFKEPLYKWIEVLGDDYVYIGEDEGYQKAYDLSGSERFIYPDLGIDIAIQVNIKDVRSDWVDGQVGTLKDPYNRFITTVRISMNPKAKANPSKIYREGTEGHPFYTMYVDYAIDFYGAVVDGDVSIKSVLSQSDIVKRNRKFSFTLGVYSGYENLGSLMFNDFYGEKPEIPMRLAIWPTLKLRLENERRYFGKVVSR
ncbi:hypothetical protein [Thaumasiovibrio subtropicus]|uniref:DUF7738 domain-containing protein n=1 Tax=Thaumasiovibrio subtropicus TaxID=1891207 RepID=UPI000B3616D6|nr:hypothetical protein [Thaumasiovibrio subtropicus]